MDQQLYEMIQALGQQNHDLTVTIQELLGKIKNLENELKKIKSLTVASSPIVNEEERKSALIEYTNIQTQKQNREELVNMFK